MSKKPKLPGAAEFFAIPQAIAGREEEGTNRRGREEAPARGTGAEGGERPEDTEPKAMELAPPLTIPEGPTEKVTFYLHPMLLKRLELVKAQLLVEHNLKVTRSQIMEYLLEEGLESQAALIEALLERAE